MEGRIPLVLLPGLDGTGRLFAPLLTELPQWLDPKVITYPADEPLPYEALLESIRATLPAGPFFVLGESFSGPLAVLLAAAEPTRVRGVVLAASFATSPVWLPLAALWCRSVIFRWQPRFALRALLTGRDAPPELLSELAAALASVSAGVIAFRVRQIAKVDARAALRASTAPLLYLRATHDRLVRRRSLDQIAQVRPDCESVALDAPHFVLQRQPERAAAAIASFIERRRSSSARTAP